MAAIFYSSNEEEYRYDDPYDALADIIESGDKFDVGDTVEIWSGELTAHKASHYLPPCVEDSLSEDAYDNVGEFAEGWPDCNAEQSGELRLAIETAVDAWADKHSLQPGFGLISNSKSIKVRLKQVEPTIEYEVIS